MGNQLPKKYVLVNTKTKKYFAGHVPTNKPVWTDSPTDAAKYNERDAYQMKKRLSCQGQNVIIVTAKMICPVCNKNLLAPGRDICVDCSRNIG